MMVRPNTNPTINIESSSEGEEEEENVRNVDPLRQAASCETSKQRLDTLFQKTDESPQPPVLCRRRLNSQQTASQGSPRKLMPKSATKEEKKRIAPTFVGNRITPHVKSPPASTHAHTPEASKRAPSTLQQYLDANDLYHFEEELLHDDEPASPSASPAPIDFYASHCWSCRCRLKETAEKRVCLYDLHVHPYLQVPICAICVEDVQDVIGNDLCSGCCCTEEEDTHLLCDACDRAFCYTCVGRANGSEDVAQRLLHDTSSTWSCLMCDTPPALKSIQVPDVKDEEQHGVGNDVSEETITEWLNRLDAIEDELDTCAKQERGREHRKKRIRSEMKKQGLRGQKLDERAQREFRSYEQQWFRHHRRLEDSRSVCQDNLDSMGVSLMLYYKKRKSLFPDELETSPSDVEPDWKIAADNEIDQREQERRRMDAKSHTTRMDADSSDEDFDELSDVEDLGEDADDEWENSDEVREWRGQWRNANVDREFVQKKLKKYMKREGERKQRIRHRISAKSDVDEVEREKRATMVRQRGVTVRRDTIVHLKRRTARTTNPVNAGERRKVFGSRAPASERPFPDDVAPQQVRVSIPAGVFGDSSLVLSETSAKGLPIAVAKPLAEKLMPHQIEGVRFMWDKTFSHLAKSRSRQDASKSPGGIILAHYMGLGKTIQTIALLHSLMNHPAFVDEASSLRMIHKVLLIVPANTIANWCAEFRKWTENLSPSISVFNLSLTHSSHRDVVVADWGRNGGVLLLGKDMFTRLAGKADNVAKAGIREQLLNPGADVVVLDEAHTQLKSATTEIGKALDNVGTKMRICLSGSPFNNNLREYFRMSSWVRPGVLGSEAQFERQFVGPIMEGMPADATEAQVSSQVRKTQELSSITSKFMHRLDKGALAQTLSPLLETVIHVRQTKLQRRLMRVFTEKSKELERSGKKLSFFEHYQAMRPLSNHPACLLLRKSKEQSTKEQQATAGGGDKGAVDVKVKNAPDTNKTKGTVVSVKLEGIPAIPRALQGGNVDDAIEIDTTDDEENILTYGAGSLQEGGVWQQPGERKRRGSRRLLPADWWAGVLEDRGEEAFMLEFAGYKIVMLIQILAHADILGEKTVVFSQCLTTLRFIESVLQSESWGQKLFGYRYLPDDHKERFCKWSKGKEYLAMDGSTHPQERGELIDHFNSSTSCKVFLISIAAGGIGVNLTGANRVVIFDNHWNPTVSTQAISRCWRFGQTKPVYAYRFITEGSIEEKVFARLVNKSGLAARVIDQKYPERMFVGRELEQITQHDIWACCDLCGKWRMLIFENDQEKAAIDDDDRLWSCDQNRDPSHNRCDIQEHDQSWYSRNMAKLRRKFEKAEGATQQVSETTPGLDALDVQDVARTKQLIDEDEILRRLEIADIFDYRPENAVKSPSKKKGKKSPSKKKKGSKSFARKVVSRVRFTHQLLKGTKTDLEMEATHAKTTDQQQNKKEVPSLPQVEAPATDNVVDRDVVFSTSPDISTGVVAAQPPAKQGGNAHDQAETAASKIVNNLDLLLKEQHASSPTKAVSLSTKSFCVEQQGSNKQIAARALQRDANKKAPPLDVAHLPTKPNTTKRRKVSNTIKPSATPTAPPIVEADGTNDSPKRKRGNTNGAGYVIKRRKPQVAMSSIKKRTGKTNDEAISLLSDSDSE